MFFKSNLFTIFLIFLVLMALSSSSYSQTGTIVVTVLSGDGIPLYKAVVSVDGSGKSFETDKSGKHSYPSMSPQLYNLTIIKDFYDNGTTSANVRDGETTEVSVKLTKSNTSNSLALLSTFLKSEDVVAFNREIDNLIEVCKANNFKNCQSLQEIKEISSSEAVYLPLLKGKTSLLLYDLGIMENLNVSREDILSSIGRSYLSMNQYTKAAESFKLSIEENPTNPDTYYYLGTTELKQKDYNNAIVAFTKSIQFESGSTFAYTNRAEAYAQKGNLNAAISDYKEALSQNPADADLYKSRAGILVQKKNFTAAIRDFTDAIRLKPNNPELYRLRANAFDAIGDEASAKADKAKADSLENK